MAIGGQEPRRPRSGRIATAVAARVLPSRGLVAICDFTDARGRHYPYSDPTHATTVPTARQKRKRMSGGLEIKLFGVFMAERDGKPLDRLPSRKVRDLLAYLLLNRRTPRAREQMAALFWPELDGDKARHCLNTALWRLRGALN